MDKEIIKTGSFESIPGKILILGSRATAKSLKHGMYYTSNKNGNIIWDVLDYTFASKHTNFKELQLKLIEQFNHGEDISGTKKQMIDLLEECNVGLSDVLFECESENSLDSSIRNGVVNPNLESLCLNADIVLLNGSKAGMLFKKEIKKWKNKPIFFIMPSTSNMQGKNVKSKDERIKEWSGVIKAHK